MMGGGELLLKLEKIKLMLIVKKLVFKFRLKMWKIWNWMAIISIQ